MSMPSVQSRSFTVPAGRDRRNSPNPIGPDLNHVKISASDTHGTLAVFAYEGHAMGGPPLHVHPDQDEIFIVQAGRYRFQCGDDHSLLTAGDTIFLPRGIPHSFGQMSPEGSLLYMFTPAGDMEAFFAALADAEGPPSPEAAAALFARHGMEVVGPPLAMD